MAGRPNPIWTIKMEYLHTWEVMEGFVESGQVKGIGVSNFTQENLQHLIGVRCTAKPQRSFRLMVEGVCGLDVLRGAEMGLWGGGRRRRRYRR